MNRSSSFFWRAVSWFARFRRINVVKDFGADNTGTYDATVAIQNAVNSAAARRWWLRWLPPREVYLPSGLYIISHLEIPGGVRLVGWGDHQ